MFIEGNQIIVVNNLAFVFRFLLRQPYWARGKHVWVLQRAYRKIELGISAEDGKAATIRSWVMMTDQLWQDSCTQSAEEKTTTAKHSHTSFLTEKNSVSCRQWKNVGYGGSRAYFGLQTFTTKGSCTCTWVQDVLRVPLIFNGVWSGCLFITWKPLLQWKDWAHNL